MWHHMFSSVVCISTQSVWGPYICGVSCIGASMIPYRYTVVCGNKMPTRCNRGFYCRSYCLLNMFRAPLCPSSGVQELLVWCGAEGYVSGLQDAAASCKPDTQPSAPHQASYLKTTARNTTDSNHCIILLSS